MPTIPELSCSVCGKRMTRVKGSLPDGQAKCRPCRQADPRPRYQPRPKTVVSKLCAYCGAEFTHPTRAYKSKYCGNQCREKDRTLRHDNRCTCGALMERRAKQCKDCRVSKYKARPEGYKPRGKRYRSTSQALTIQTPEMRRQHKLRLHLTPVKEPKTLRIFKSGTCTVCAASFVSLNVDVTCSDTCQAIHRANVRREGKHKRRALVKQAYVSPVNRLTIYTRDSWTCQLCGEPVDKEEQAPHPLSPSIDHITPLNKGGTHEPSNVQTAHFLCNSMKGDREWGEGVAGVP